ncbi:MAG: sigma-70 family RNA polymerase sigma factor [Actinomycetota bacterium]|nr:sigma-70 family RNA polymerase sigma factor [Actinomycetota bacterium]
MTMSAAAVARRLPQAPATATMSFLSHSDVSDGELIRLVGSGDRSAFDALYRRYARPVFGLALRRLGDRGRAEDAVQETFASVWRAARSYRPERGPGAPWLYAVARNAIVDNGRARREPPVDAPDEVAGDDGPADRAESGWVAWRVHRALAELPESERRVIELAYWGGRSQSEIADLLGIPLGTVKTRTRTGLARLAAVLEDVL